MSVNNKKADPKKIYSYLDRPPVMECGGKLDADGVDSYWGPSLTVQSEAESADITLIMEKYTRTGNIDAHIRQNLQYGDTTLIPDYHTAYNQIAHANELFDTLDAKIRSRFQNDPAKMIDFLQNRENYDEAVKLGLVSKKEINENNSNPPALKVENNSPKSEAGSTPPA